MLIIGGAIVAAVAGHSGTECPVICAYEVFFTDVPALLTSNVMYS
jgi:hypothetical protein